MLKIPFIKYQGAGNDFILIDFRHGEMELDLASFARTACERRWGIGADGLLLLLPSSVADYRMRIFNADGSEPTMCGNGIRCLANFLFKQEGAPFNLAIETLHGILHCRKAGEQIAVNLGPPSVLHWPIQMEYGPVYVVHTGVPHAVVFVENVDVIDVNSLGRKIRFDRCFAESGVNVNFVMLKSQNTLRVRTYERGVEGETLACGTGAAAAAYVASVQLKLSSPMTIQTRCSFDPCQSQYSEHLCFLFPQNDQGKTEIEMLGNAEVVFEGTINVINT
jgi:diaminopimelate epimerase